MKLYEKFLKKKLENKDKIYLFKNGIFYISLEDDAKFLCSKYGFSLTQLNSEIVKCGFPVKSLNKYLSIFDNDGINYEVVNENNINLIIKKLEKVDIKNVTPVEAINILNELVNLL